MLCIVCPSRERGRGKRTLHEGYYCAKNRKHVNDNVSIVSKCWSINVA